MGTETALFFDRWGKKDSVKKLKNAKRTGKKPKKAKPDGKPKFVYTKAEMMEAINSVKEGRMTCFKAAKMFNVPRSTLENKVKGASPIDCKMGPGSILTAQEEEIIVNWIHECACAGFPIIKLELINSVQRLIVQLKRKNPFTDGIPGRKWFHAFLARHPTITQRVPQNLTSSRAAVTKEALIKWSSEVEAFLREKNLFDILKDGTRVWNADEAAFFLNPKGNKVLVTCGEKNFYALVNTDEKENLTVLLTANATGLIAPPLIVCNHDRIPKDIADSTPMSWGLGRSPNGWMTAESFFEYITNIFHPFLLHKNVTLPVILFIDGHSSHQSLHLSEFCQENGITLVALHPNSTHLIQPMDVAVLRTLKSSWKTEVYRWRMNNGGVNLKKSHFCPLLKNAIETSVTLTVLQNGFKKSGLFPWNIDNVDFSKILKRPNTTKDDETTKTDEGKTKKLVALKVFEEEIGSEKVAQFKILKQGNSEMEIPLEDKSLYKLWASLINSNNLDPSTKVADNEADGNITPNLLEEPIVVDRDEDINLNSAKTDTEDLSLLQFDNLVDLAVPMDFSSPADDDDYQYLENLLTGDNLEKELELVMNSTESNTIAATPEIDSDELQDKENTPENNNKNENGRNGVETNVEKNNQSLKISENMLENSPSDKDKPIHTPKPNRNKPVQSHSAPPGPSKRSNNSPKVPTPFKTALFWPARRADEQKNRRKTEKIPSVISSEAWQTYYQNNTEKKKQAEELKTKKKQEREDLKAKKMKAAEELKEKRRKAVGERKLKGVKPKRKGKQDESHIEAMDSDCSDSVDTPSSPDIVSNNEVTADLVSVNSYVIVSYEGELFPGMVLKKESTGATVKVMTMAGVDGWKWPEKEDVLCYSYSDIKAIIEPPTLKNNRGVCSVPEIVKCKKRLNF